MRPILVATLVAAMVLSVPTVSAAPKCVVYDTNCYETTYVSNAQAWNACTNGDPVRTSTYEAYTLDAVVGTSSPKESVRVLFVNTCSQSTLPGGEYRRNSYSAKAEYTLTGAGTGSVQVEWTAQQAGKPTDYCHTFVRYSNVPGLGSAERNVGCPLRTADFVLPYLPPGTYPAPSLGAPPPVAMYPILL